LSLNELYYYLRENSDIGDSYSFSYEDRKCQLTEYAAYKYVEAHINSGESEEIAQAAYDENVKSKDNYCWYWLRTMTNDRRFPVEVSIEGFADTLNRNVSVNKNMGGLRSIVWISLEPKSENSADETPPVNTQPSVESKGLLGYITDSALGFDDDTVAGICRLMGVNYYEYDDCEVFVLFDDSDEALVAAARNLIDMGAESLVFNVGDLSKYEPVRKQLAEEFRDVRLLPIVN